MHYFTSEEMTRLLTVSYTQDRLFHLAALVSLSHGLRVTEMRSLTCGDVDGEYLNVRPLKDGIPHLEPIQRNDSPIFDEGAISVLVHGLLSQGGNSLTPLFGLSRQAWDKKMRKMCAMAGIPDTKSHWHALRHTCGHMVFQNTVSLGCVSQALRHKSLSSALAYLHEHDAGRAYSAVSKGLAGLAELAGG